MTEDATPELQEDVAEEEDEATAELYEPLDMWEIVQKRAKKNWYTIC